MVNCPKCNFNQPKDRFCANCGIDMDAYRPTMAPFAVRLAKNWIFQLSVLSVVLVLGFSLIRAKNRAQLVESFSAFEQAASSKVSGQRQFLSQTPSTTISKNIAEVGGAQKAPTQNPDPKGAAENLPASAAVAGAANIAAQPTSMPSAQTGVSRLADSLVGDATSLPTKLKLIFAEVSRTTLASLLNDSRSIASFGTYFAGLIPDRDEKIKIESSVSGLTVLDSAADLQIKLNQPIILFKGSRDPVLDQNIGLTTQITPTLIDDAGAHLQIEVRRAIRAPAGTNPPIQEDSYQEQMTLKKDARGFMSGLLPHRTLTDEEVRNLGSNSTILKVLGSPDFQSGNSEFVVFVEAK